MDAIYIIKNKNVKTHIERKYITHNLLKQGWKIIGLYSGSEEIYFGLIGSENK